MCKPIIVCISGKARSGKGEFSRFAIEHLAPTLKCQELAYGDFVKFVCYKYFGCTYERNEYNRTQWQQVGTELGRAGNKNIWINMTIELVKGIFNDCDFIFIPDNRFPNEIDRWEEEGFEVISIRVEREDFEDNMTPEQRAHKSEVSLDEYGFDYKIKNSGTLEEYREKVIDFVSKTLV